MTVNSDMPWAAIDNETDEDLRAFWEFYATGAHRIPDPQLVTHHHTLNAQRITDFQWFERAAMWDAVMHERMCAAISFNETLAQYAQAASKAAGALRRCHRLTAGLPPSRLAFMEPVDLTENLVLGEMGSAQEPEDKPPEKAKPAKKPKRKSYRLADPVERDECGTDAGRDAHRKNKERLCPKCRKQGGRKKAKPKKPDPKPDSVDKPEAAPAPEQPPPASVPEPEPEPVKQPPPTAPPAPPRTAPPAPPAPPPRTAPPAPPRPTAPPPPPIP